MKKIVVAVCLIVTTAAAAHAQTASEAIDAGDADYRARRASTALAHYERALAADPDNFEALWKASRSALDLASGPTDTEARRMELLQAGERYARRALALRPGDAEGYFALARALGKTSQSLGVRAKIRSATAIRENALQCVRLNPGHSGCHHILGVWNAEVMRLGGFERVIARNLLGGRALGAASWANALKHLEQAVALAPHRIIHHLELGDLYRDRREWSGARREYETALRLEIADYNDERYKAQAQAALRALP